MTLLKRILLTLWLLCLALPAWAAFDLTVQMTIYHTDGSAGTQQQTMNFETKEACDAVRNSLLTQNWVNPFPIPDDPEAAKAYTFARYRTSECTERAAEAQPETEAPEAAPE